MKRRRKVTLPDGSAGYENIDLRKKLNLSYLRYTNLTHAAGKHDLPALACNTEVFPDYIALSGYPSQYHKTPLTAVGFWEYDEKFDGYEGLFNAIYYDQEDLLERYRSRYAGVRFLFTPDYSQFGDVSDLEEHYRLLKARIVGIWFAMELGAVSYRSSRCRRPRASGSPSTGWRTARSWRSAPRAMSTIPSSATSSRNSSDSP